MALPLTELSDGDLAATMMIQHAQCACNTVAEGGMWAQVRWQKWKNSDDDERYGDNWGQFCGGHSPNISDAVIISP